MTPTDPNLERAIDDLSQAWNPPPGAEGRMLADFHARLAVAGTEGDPSSEFDGDFDGDLDADLDVDLDPGFDAGFDASFDPGLDPSPALELASSPGASSLGGAGKVLYFAKAAGALAGLTTAGLGALWLAAAPMRTPTAPASTEAEVALSAPEVSASEGATDPTPTTIPLADTPEPPAADLQPSPSPGTEAERPSPAAPRSATSEAAGPQLAAELALLREAREAPAARSLVLLEQHRKRFPSSTLADEREALRIARLCSVGRYAEAERAREPFEAGKPSALLRRQVELACDGGKK